MENITLDFRNRWLVFETDAQILSVQMDEKITKNVLLLFFRDKQAYLKGDNYTLDFVDKKIIMNVSFEWNRIDMYTKDLLVPVAVFDFACKALTWDEMLDVLGYASVDMSAADYIAYCDENGFSNNTDWKRDFFKIKI